MGKPDLEDNWDNYNSADLTKYVFSSIETLEHHSKSVIKEERIEFVFL